MELVDAGWNIMVRPLSAKSVHDAITHAMLRKGISVQLYGNGYAVQKIVKILSSQLIN